MKMKTNIMTICLCLILFVSTFFNPLYIYASVTGDIKSDPIVLTQKQTKNTVFSKDGNVKYFKLIVKETGTATISLTSNKLKNSATISLFYDEGGVYCDEAVAKYNKKTKTVKGSLSTSKLLMPGQYNITINTDKVSKDTKFTIKTTFEKYDCKDIEPNNKEENAQSISVTTKKKVTTYNMLLSGETNSLDMIDYFTFDLKNAKKIKVSATAQGTDRIRVLIKRETATGTEVINANESDQYFQTKKGKNIFTFTSKKALPKGTYYIMVWLEDGQNIQVPYTIKTHSL